MSDWQNDPERAGIENIVRSLRKPFHLDETFELRVMSAVQAEALAKTDRDHSAQRQSWWTRRYTIRFTALAGLAAAASIIAVVALSAAMLSRNPQSSVRQQTAVSSVPAVPVVHFVLVNESAKQVYLVGDFNNWSKTPLTRTASQKAWSISVPLNDGRHEYAFIVDDETGEHWVADPLSAKVEDEFGTESSIVRVGPTSS